MHKSVPKSGNFDPRDLRVAFLELIRQIVNVFPNVVQRRRDRPLHRFFLTNFLWRDLLPLYISQELLCGFPDLLDPLLVTVLHAIWTPSAKIAS